MTQLKEDLSQISEDDHGVKTFKRELLAEIDRRMGRFEEEEQYSLACSLDPRCLIILDMSVFKNMAKFQSHGQNRAQPFLTSICDIMLSVTPPPSLDCEKIC